MKRRKRLMIAAWLLIPAIVLGFHLLKILTPPRKIQFTARSLQVVGTIAARPADDFREGPAVGPEQSEPRPKGTPMFGAFAGRTSVPPAGSLAGRVLFINAGHGWQYSDSTATNRGWRTGRSATNGILEDFGNLDQMTMFADYAFNSGATIVPLRPIGFQTNEVILDNDDPGVFWKGAWRDSTSTVYYGRSGAVPYRFAPVSSETTATATYVPHIPEPGFYPVYAWARHGADRTSQLYDIHHTGGQTTVRVPHHLVGNGWVYLGKYFFNAGSNAALGSVRVSNRSDEPTHGLVVLADAIRFGNGMGDLPPRARGQPLAAPSGQPREEECAKYWIRSGIGQGQPAEVFEGNDSDEKDNINAPPRMARQMNREAGGSLFKRIYLSFHSNSSDGRPRGALALFNHKPRFPDASTPNQRRLADLVGREVNDTLAILTWPGAPGQWLHGGTNVVLSRRDFAFGEINNRNIGNEFDATIVELGYHDNIDDAVLLREPKVRMAAARAVYQGVVRYMHQFDQAPLAFLPEPPRNLSATQQPDTGIRLQWTPQESSDGYRVYRSMDGYGFGNPIHVEGISNCAVSIADVPAGRAIYFRVAAVNAGGESLPSTVVACRRSSNGPAPRVLFVNGFDRFDRGLNVRQVLRRQDATSNEVVETFERIKPRLMNSFDYVVQHGKALADCGADFDASDHGAVTTCRIQLSNYAAVIWALGRESTADQTLDAEERKSIAEYLKQGGSLFISGTDLAWDLGRSNGATAEARAFLEQELHARLASHADDDAGTYAFEGEPGSLFDGLQGGQFDDGTKGIYKAERPDILTPVGNGSTPALRYVGSGKVAAIHYSGSGGRGRVMFMGFPFETITTRPMRAECMARVLRYFNVPTHTAPPPESGRSDAL